MFIEISQLPTDIQKFIIQGKEVISILDKGLPVAIITPTDTKETTNAYDYFCSFEYPSGVGDGDFELPARSTLTRQTVDFD